MKKNNLIQVTFSTEELETCKNHIEGLDQFASKNTPNLSNEDRRNFGSITQNNKLLIEKIKSLMEQYPERVPPFVDSKEFNKDYQARKQIEEILLQLDIIKRKLTDTKILLDYDNFQDALAFYRSIRYFASEYQNGAIPLYEQLKQYFPHRKNGKETKE
ncbi:MAG: hypothetical protein ACEPOZ_14330 [Marinifilaceae bacterium]